MDGHESMFPRVDGSAFQFILNAILPALFSSNLISPNEFSSLLNSSITAAAVNNSSIDDPSQKIPLENVSFLLSFFSFLHGRKRSTSSFLRQRCRSINSRFVRFTLKSFAQKNHFSSKYDQNGKKNLNCPFLFSNLTKFWAPTIQSLCDESFLCRLR